MIIDTTMKHRFTLIALLAAMMMAMASCSSSTSSDELEQLVEISKKSLPMIVDEITVWKDMAVEEGSVVYSYDVNDSTGTVVAGMPGNHDNIVFQIGESLNEKEFLQFVQLVVNDGKDVKYRYTDTRNGMKSEITITNEELSQTLAAHKK